MVQFQRTTRRSSGKEEQYRKLDLTLERNLTTSLLCACTCRSCKENLPANPPQGLFDVEKDLCVVLQCEFAAFTCLVQFCGLIREWSNYNDVQWHNKHTQRLRKTIQKKSITASLSKLNAPRPRR